MNKIVYDKTKKLFPSFSMAKRLVMQLEDSLAKKLGRPPNEDELTAEMERVGKGYKNED